MELSANKSLCLGHQIGSPEPVLCVLVPYAVHYVCSGETPEDSLLPKLSGTPIYHLRLPLLRPFQGPSNTRTLFPLPSFSFPHIISSVYTGYHRITEGSHKHHHEIIVISGSHYGKVRVSCSCGKTQEGGAAQTTATQHLTAANGRVRDEGRQRRDRKTDGQTCLTSTPQQAGASCTALASRLNTCLLLPLVLFISTANCSRGSFECTPQVRVQAASHAPYPYRIQHLKVNVEVKSGQAKQHSQRISDR
jgi:hypothetical protein